MFGAPVGIPAFIWDWIPARVPVAAAVRDKRWRFPVAAVSDARAAGCKLAASTEPEEIWRPARNGCKRRVTGIAQPRDAIEQAARVGHPRGSEYSPRWALLHDPPRVHDDCVIRPACDNR